MAILRYQVSRLDHHWLVSCEDVPIDLFDGRQTAIGAAMDLVRAARVRGDQPVLKMDPAQLADEGASAGC